MIDIPIAHVSVQLPLAEVVAQTVPSIWEGYDGPEEARQIVDRMYPGDRMMLATRLTLQAGCPATAAIVASALAHRGWVCWVMQETISRDTSIARPHVARAIGQLEKAGLITHHVLRRGRKRVATVYSWVCTNLVHGAYQIGTSWEPERDPERELIEESFPVPVPGSGPGSPPARAREDCTNLVRSEDGDCTNLVRSEDGAHTDLVCGEDGDCTNLVRGEDGVRTDLVRGEDGVRTDLVRGEDGVHTDLICSEDGSTYQSDMSPPPRWWAAFVHRGRWDPPPRWDVISEHAALAGWSEDHVYRAAQQMTRTYMGVTVSDPDQLLRTIAASLPLRPR